MGDGCCAEFSAAGRDARQRRTLWAVLAVNLLGFAGMGVGARLAGSSALLADTLDFLGDALTYGLSLWAVGRGLRAKAQVALFKGGLILAAALWVVAEALWRLSLGQPPLPAAMGAFACAGLGVNGLCLALLSRHRHEDVNMRSVWECSRNDIVAGLSVVGAAASVAVTGSVWPDVLVALFLAGWLAASAARVVAAARADLVRDAGAG
ncbi:MAG: hypothetical protein KatS3mg124_2365 [Porticoccaceae bacterium]|nr:MAG: hypothetical protein KatS3mg124_2365 [Porticoccaceae bacterium]